MDPKAYWVGFNLVKGVGAVRLKALLDFFGDLSLAWQAPIDALRSAGLPARSLESFLSVRSSDKLERTWESIQKQDIQVMTWDDENYPRMLREVDQSPPVLYVRGEILEEDDLAAAIVGTRRITPYGRQVTEEVSTFLARNCVTVVSGLARGVDAVAHHAAMKAGGRTIAVLGSGVDRIYPPEHANLAAEIMTKGAVISDYAPGTPPDAVNFPPRNRIVSGLSLATIVIEAGNTSGALITAQFALDQGRDVAAVPGGIYAPQSKGCNRLIRDGARPLLEMDDLLEILNLGKRQQHAAARVLLPADETEKCLLGVLHDQPVHIDEICHQSGLTIERVSATLTMMELKGMIRHTGSMNYTIIREASSGDWSD